jgi:hypothetical protein
LKRFLDKPAVFLKNVSIISLVWLPFISIMHLFNAYHILSNTSKIPYVYEMLRQASHLPLRIVHFPPLPGASRIPSLPGVLHALALITRLSLYWSLATIEK